MPLTREFKETVQARIRQDRRYRKELLREGVRVSPGRRSRYRKSDSARLHQRDNRVRGTQSRHETTDQKPDAHVRS